MHIGLTAAVLGGLLTSVPSSIAAAEPANQGSQRVIVELTGDGALAAAPGPMKNARAADVKEQRQKLKARQDAFLADAKDRGVDARSVRELNLLANAVAMTVDGADVAKLRALPGVRSVVEDGMNKAAVAEANKVVGNPEVWQQRDPSGANVTGKGTTVAVLDTGVDYSHPDLGGAFGEGHKVVGGYDFVNDDADPMDDHSHGTHVAGIIAGKAAADGGVTGAAPDAQIMAYKVLNADGYGPDSQIIAALEAAVDPANPHRADIVNMSLGDAQGTATDAVARAASAAAASGALVFAAAGNIPGYELVGSPAAAPGVIAVGATTSGIRLPVVEVPGADEPLSVYRGARSANPPAEPVTAEVVNLGEGSPEDWERVGDVSGKIVLYPLPPAPENPYDVFGFELEVWREAEKRGAIALIGGVGGGGGPVVAGGSTRANPLTGQSGPGTSVAREAASGDTALLAPSGFRPDESGDSLRMDKLAIMGVDLDGATALAALAESGGSVTLSGRDDSDSFASFSSRGPEREGLTLKPEIVAPGVEIRSTVPKGLRNSDGSAVWPDGYAHFSGTSMATPLAAGSAALLHQLHPDRPLAELGAQVIGTAKPLAGLDLMTQGNGRLDTAAAAATALSASPATVSFGMTDTDRAKVGGTRTVTLHNSGATPVSGAVTVSGRAEVTPEHVDIPAGGSAAVTLTVEADGPDATDDSTTQISGRVTVTPDRGPRLTVPYLMFAFPLYVEAADDPSVDGETLIYALGKKGLKTPPVLTVTPPKGAAFTVTMQPTAVDWVYAANLTGLDSGTYTMSASGVSVGGVRQTGSGAFEVTRTASSAKRWKPIGPNSTVGTTHLAPGDPDQAVMTSGLRPGAWLTTDKGRNWQQLNHTPVRDALYAPQLVVDSTDPKRWWEVVVSGHPTAFPDGTVVLRTEDRGRSWERMPVPAGPVDTLTADDRTRVLLAGDTGSGQYYASRDGARSWQAVDLAGMGITDWVGQVKFGGDDLYVWAGQKIWKIPGFATGNPGPAVTVFAGKIRETHLLGFDVDDDLVVVMAQGKNAGVHISRDAGATFEKSTRPNSGRVLVEDGEILHDALFGGIARSLDGGRTWTPVAKPVSGSVVTDYDRWADGSYTLGLSSSGLYRGDGGALKRLGVQAESVSSLATAGDKLFAATRIGTYRTPVGSADPEWGHAEGEGTISSAIGALRTSPKEPGSVWRLFNGFTGLAVQKSTDGGATWQDVSPWLDGSGQGFMVDPADPDRMAVSYRSMFGSGVYTTTDGGATWKTRKLGLSFDVIEADPQVPGRIWLGNAYGLWRSDDFGATTPERITQARVATIEFTGGVMLTGGDAIRRSTDGGKTFTNADTGVLPVSVTDITGHGGTLYAGTAEWWVDFTPTGARGVLKSTDGGKTWRNISRGMPDKDVLSLQVSPDGRYLFAGVDQGGVYRLELDD
ncbi:S8 family serine peptidase [Streptomyces sp. NPDC051940]|uniref:S8 family serine peptidase n=1 Tax=Streptomyces sp. NPDC051940 TaxID=3155675 RepID=UPI00341D0A6A